MVDQKTMLDADSPPSTRIRVADSVLDHSAKGIELEDIEAPGAEPKELGYEVESFWPDCARANGSTPIATAPKLKDLLSNVLLPPFSTLVCRSRRGWPAIIAEFAYLDGIGAFRASGLNRTRRARLADESWLSPLPRRTRSQA